MSFSVVAPASSANLGPGFDCLAIALDLWMRVDVELDGGDGVRAGTSPDLLGGDNLVVAAMRYAGQQLDLDLPGCVVTASGDIPVARGMGSSAAAIVAGVRAACVLAGRAETPDSTIIDVAGRFEGHADNVAAATLGGVTVALPVDTGFIAESIVSAIPWTPVVFIPTTAGFTHKARGVLPDRVPMIDAIANVGRSAMLTYALQTGREDVLREAMQDRLHQPYRVEIFPYLPAVIAAANAAGAVGACLSGAGPTILALARAHCTQAVGCGLVRAAAEYGVHGIAESIPVAPRGCHVLPG